MRNKNLHVARAAKDDEFYTQLPDIENELQHYKNQLKDKVIYCNCDDYSKSNFFKYFKDNFRELGLKKLIATCYKNQERTLLKLSGFEPATMAVYDGTEISVRHLEGDGDFRSVECIELLKQADIVITNPPFSLFREYVAQLMEYDKKFLIMGGLNAIKYKEIFKLVKKNKLWVGINNGLKKFNRQSGNKSFVMTLWHTNLSVPPKKWLKLVKVYDPKIYPKYDNYGAINVDKVKDIPMDYDGEMGVPISFLIKFNPDQFEVVTVASSRSTFTPTKYYIKPYQISKTGNKVYEPVVNRALTLEVETPPENKTYYVSSNSKYLILPFARILIKRK